MPLFDHVPHPHIATRARAARDPVRRRGPVARFNNRLAVLITRGVGTMWCAYLFTAIALASLPASIATGDPVTIVSWVAQTFLQLVLLSVILLGGNISAASADERDERTYLDAEAVLHTATEIQQHLAAQDEALTSTLGALSEHSGLLSDMHTRLGGLTPSTPPATGQAGADTEGGGPA
ncbi:hypothetical protein KGQ20_02210 [Catenulispora sp. NF23]|uniref:DUF1003 domain-containing protein n=1 Tax=Catenulispora pinistramenti TaxID=2705254 RepID=A0ABS5KKH3_9ACTN|nr:hypothetical protein [Catenulispora pinistramenti]MBS2531579.1 hypothetical protein [Catenulispora pinistramenti]MBS2546171.1 hypothetical protein [Catenulispora pinistramenti]